MPMGYMAACQGKHAAQAVPGGAFVTVTICYVCILHITNNTKAEQGI